jgi:hypothetical protein
MRTRFAHSLRSCEIRAIIATHSGMIDPRQFCVLGFLKRDTACLCKCEGDSLKGIQRQYTAFIQIGSRYYIPSLPPPSPATYTPSS